MYLPGIQACTLAEGHLSRNGSSFRESYEISDGPKLVIGAVEFELVAGANGAYQL